jgi:hypothetical protein
MVERGGGGDSECGVRQLRRAMLRAVVHAGTCRSLGVAPIPPPALFPEALRGRRCTHAVKNHGVIEFRGWGRAEGGPRGGWGQARTRGEHGCHWVEAQTCISTALRRVASAAPLTLPLWLWNLATLREHAEKAASACCSRLRPPTPDPSRNDGGEPRRLICALPARNQAGPVGPRRQKRKLPTTPRRDLRESCVVRALG